jgi:mono/diheme cytochrome c family protein
MRVVRPRHRWAWLACCLVAAGVAGGIAAAQPGSSVTAPPARAAELLSFTAAQAASGKAEFATSCGVCHGANLNDGEFGGAPLKGEEFRGKWFGQPVGALVGYTSAAMPPDSPGRLPFETYVEIVAYLLGANGIAPGTRALPADMKALATLRVLPETGSSAAERTVTPVAIRP